MMAEPITMEEFTDAFISYVMNYYGISDWKELSETDQESIKELSNLKYRQDSWNIGYSPAYRFINEFELEGESWKVVMAVNNSLIASAELSGPQKYSGLIKKIEEMITGKVHEKKSIEKQLRTINFVSAKDIEVLNQLIVQLF